MAALREILVSFGVEFDTKPLEHGEHKVESMLGKISELGKLLAEAFVVKELFEFVKGTSEQAVALEHAAAATGLATDELQAWQLGAAEAGVESDEFTMGLRRLSVALAGGKDSAGSQAEIFAKLGIKTKDAAGNVRGLGDVLPQIAEHFKGMSDGAGKAALAQELFGRQGARLIPLLNKGSEGVKELKKDLEELGGGFSPEFIEQAAKQEKQSKRLDVAWKGLKQTIVGYLLNGLTWLTEKLIKLGGWFKKLADSSNIVQAALAVLATFAVAKAGILIATWWKVIAPFLGWAAAIAVIVLLVDDLITAWQGGDSAIGRLIDHMFGPGSTKKAVGWTKEIGSGLSEMFATASNNSEEFDRTWNKSLDDMRGSSQGFQGFWGGFLALLEDPFYAMIKGFSSGWGGVWNYLAGTWLEVAAAMQLGLDEISDAAKRTFAFIADKIAWLSNNVSPILRQFGVTLDHQDEDHGDRLTAEQGERDKVRFRQIQDVDDQFRNRGQYAYAPNGRTLAVGDKHFVTNVTVPPGTPTQQARAVAAAAERGAAKGAGAGVPLKNPNRAAAAGLGRFGK